MQTASAHCSLNIASHLVAQHLRKQSRSPVAQFRCPEPGCSRMFNRKYTLVEHQKTHTGEKPYVCPVRSCSKRFTTTGNLSRHRRLHGPVLPLQCPAPDCECTFASEIKLAKHMKFHLGTAEHVCRVPGCGKTFSTMGNHNRHMRNQHNIYHDLCDDASAAPCYSPTKTARAASNVSGGAYSSAVGAQSPNGADADAWFFGWTSIDDDVDNDNDAYKSESETGTVRTMHDISMRDMDDSAWLATGCETVEPLTLEEAARPWEPEALEVLSLLLRIDDDDSSSSKQVHA